MKKKKRTILSRLSDIWHWYILGEYHCDHCPYCWEERYEDDCDAGCIIKGEIQDTCRLVPPFRGIVGFFATKRYIYKSRHHYDDLPEWYERQERKETEFKRLVADNLRKEGYVTCRRDDAGNLVEVSDNELSYIWEHIASNFETVVLENRTDYAGSCPKELRKQAREATWRSIKEWFHVYFMPNSKI